MSHSPQEFYKKMAVKGAKRRLGFSGERKAVKFLKRNGYKIIGRNYRCPFGEVDIIARTEDVLAFIEVKTRSGDGFGAPNEAVDRERRRRYVNCARFYFNGKAMDCTVRFDVIEVFRGEVNHIENAFGA